MFWNYRPYISSGEGLPQFRKLHGGHFIGAKHLEVDAGYWVDYWSKLKPYILSAFAFWLVVGCEADEIVKPDIPEIIPRDKTQYQPSHDAKWVGITNFNQLLVLSDQRSITESTRKSGKNRQFIPHPRAQDPKVNPKTRLRGDHDRFEIRKLRRESCWNSSVSLLRIRGKVFGNVCSSIV